MRLSESEIGIIKRTVTGRIPDATVYLFGSRTDDSKRGGDIDLLVEAPRKIPLTEELELLVALERNGIGRKVDLLLATPGKPVEGVYRTAKEEGILL
jgi:predicted nucleotidyltransferase